MISVIGSVLMNIFWLYQISDLLEIEKKSCLKNIDLLSNEHFIFIQANSVYQKLFFLLFQSANDQDDKHRSFPSPEERWDPECHPWAQVSVYNEDLNDFPLKFLRLQVKWNFYALYYNFKKNTLVDNTLDQLTCFSPAVRIVTLFFVAYRKERKVASMKKNPLKNKRVMNRLNPYAIAEKAAAKNVIEQRKRARQAKLDAKRGVRQV